MATSWVAGQSLLALHEDLLECICAYLRETGLCFPFASTCHTLRRSFAVDLALRRCEAEARRRKQAFEDAPYDMTIKLLLAGDLTGKQALLESYVGTDEGPTWLQPIGIDFKIKTAEIEGKKVRLHIWDTASQDRFREITSSYYRGAHGVLLVYSVQSASTLQRARDWIVHIRGGTSADVPVVLLGHIHVGHGVREVTEQRGRALADEFGMVFFEASTDTPHEMVEVFESLATSATCQRLTDAPLDALIGAATKTPSSRCVVS